MSNTSSTVPPNPAAAPAPATFISALTAAGKGRVRIDGNLYRVYARTERAAEHEVASLRAKVAGGQVSAPRIGDAWHAAAVPKTSFSMRRMDSSSGLMIPKQWPRRSGGSLETRISASDLLPLPGKRFEPDSPLRTPLNVFFTSFRQ